ncbi:NADPH-dependent FMN reductase ArsH [Gracilariopsis chorda]|uniref:NADPH-dependent FMN reductase ArsH n=1 Tax=Gracilariopsis chorda TaxID=448386 RepID=A0A2V3IUD2_9FLOR|nr:NADPH-dependent FMN reductase ArsH [Gracilariopsis chorda]|eukprot:PXF45734.1 NADPH-dependent FMN reductase ArsH [Gracilariopsis chorda]
MTAANGTPEANWLSHRSNPETPASGPGEDWVTPIVDEYLQEARDFRPAGAVHTHPPRILVLYGTLRPKGFSKLLAFECARILEALGAEVRTFDPLGLPVRDPEIQEHSKVVELRQLVYWSEAHVWAASELHGNLCGTFKNQIDWIPLNSGSVRPTQGKAVAVLQVCGGSQSFNVVNTLRLLARWMRMACVVNQSSVQKAWKEFDDDGRMKESSMRERVVDVMEEFIKFARINREYSDLLTSRYSERKEKEEKGRLLTQAEKETAKDAALENAKKEKANE